MRRVLWIAGASVIAVLIIIAMYFAIKTKQARYTEDVHTAYDSLVAAVPPIPEVLYGINIDSLVVEQGVIQRNENLSEILSRFNISPRTIAEISQLPRDTFNVRGLRASKPYTIIREDDSLKTARAFIYHPNSIDYVKLGFDGAVSVTRGTHPVDTVREVATGVIETSLYHTMIAADASPLLVNELADVYAWEIDFFGLQKGDAFKVIYEKLLVNGEQAGLGEIIGAWFRHMGKEYYAVRYDQGEGDEYFDLEGKSLRKTFLKAPLRFSRISSRFSYSRMHPVLKYRRPHTGVDYAAPPGTPVVAVGDGTVVMARYKGGGGNSVKIRHNSNYETAYLHLSRYGKGIKRGVKVTQGQVIGYVGSTGLSTGPHLDFRFWKNGKPVDPLKIDPPSANPIRPELKDAYAVVMRKVRQMLDTIDAKPKDEVI